MGIPVKPAGVVMAPELWIEANTVTDANGNHLLRPLRNESEDVTLAARDALLKMIALLTGPTSPAPVPLNAEQAYLLCSVACDLHISNLVDVPNYVVSNFLQLDVFEPA
jgi:formamidase